MEFHSTAVTKNFNVSPDAQFTMERHRLGGAGFAC
jgi:hypothetical protein